MVIIISLPLSSDVLEGKWYRLKGCGNGYEGFPLQEVPTEKDAVEIRGCMFQHTCARSTSSYLHITHTESCRWLLVWMKSLSTMVWCVPTSLLVGIYDCQHWRSTFRLLEVPIGDFFYAPDRQVLCTARDYWRQASGRPHLGWYRKLSAFLDQAIASWMQADEIADLVSMLKLLRSSFLRLGWLTRV